MSFFGENKGIMLQSLRGEQKYQVTNVDVEKIKFSRFLVQRINEFKMNEIQRKNLRSSWQTVIVSYFWALELTGYKQAADDSKSTDNPA